MSASPNDGEPARRKWECPTCGEAYKVRPPGRELTCQSCEPDTAKSEDAGGPKRPEYEPTTPEQRLAYLVEELGEATAAAGKSQRWGLTSYNPELPEDARETNAAWLRRELADVKAAIERLMPDLEAIPADPREVRYGKR